MYAQFIHGSYFSRNLLFCLYRCIAALSLVLETNRYGGEQDAQIIRPDPLLGLLAPLFRLPRVEGPTLVPNWKEKHY
jgi:hypothetical protein